MEIRVVQFFAWLPVRIGWDIRWLRTVRVRYEYTIEHGAGGMSACVEVWTPIEFLPLEQ